MRLQRMSSRSGKHSTATQERTAPAAKKYVRWTDEDDDKLKELHKKNYSVSAMASILNRTPIAVKNRISTIILKK